MLKVRVIPTLLWKNVGLVKGIAFDSWRRVGTVLPAIKVYNTREVDELILLDITATAEQRDPDYESIREFCAESFVPLTYGGGVCSRGQVRELLRAGADKVSINTAAHQNPQLITEAAQSFGSQCVVVSIDARKVGEGRYECFSQSGTRGTGRNPAAWAREAEALGAGEILITSIERDGAMAGYDLELIRQVSEAVKIPVIASGGAGSYAHMLEALTQGHASAIAAASIFHFTQQTPKEAKQYLAAHGILVRNVHSAPPTQINGVRA
ncbi:MAG TPA: imidazole glycerol phosphate synthase cyclase subunit [Candidatus Paceibacterota bacterium]|nr:imidazole glycerol phosphate synthase cyclase subunit [Verrucomicrobiota bacterium]HSA09919.1 imidazole glycerol phosphate synthase cyclase subunit [Candidatus Paceibacterota bacterium]